MHKILVFGAGRSSTALINYLLEQKSLPIVLTVADRDYSLALSKLRGKPGSAIELDIFDAEKRGELIADHDIVISLLPSELHDLAVLDAVRYKKHIITASYISENVLALNDLAIENQVMIMAELGLDPGIDHMSAMEEIDEIQKQGRLIGFKSATGGIVAPESKDNPWGYKITWNPKNVVRAGVSGGAFIQNGSIIEYDYNNLFANTETWKFPGLGKFEVYANRNSMTYKDLYGLGDIQNLYRGTIRYQGFCQAWNALIALGLTDDHDNVDPGLTYRNWTFRKVPYAINLHEVLKVLEIDDNDCIVERLYSLNLISDELIDDVYHSSAEILEQILLKQWKMQPKDKDMVLMQHQFEYEIDNVKFHKTSSLKHMGHDAVDTAMSQLVGLPMAIFAIKTLEGLDVPYGVHIPIDEKVYRPVLHELEQMGIQFETETKII